tara:strand:- start:25 stop:174 length:150 start_codon:yes stop_codon:yes gene_type:complete
MPDLMLQNKKGKLIIIAMFIQLLKTFIVGAKGHKNIITPDKIHISKSLK